MFIHGLSYAVLNLLVKYLLSVLLRSSSQLFHSAQHLQIVSWHHRDIMVVVAS